MVNHGIKTISVGNLVMGGAGKTPHTLLIANEMIKRNEKVAILSLGYKGKIGYDNTVISDGLGNLYHHPPMAADEPYMMAKNNLEAIVITGKKREKSLEIARDTYGATVAVLDDGYQYKKLKRDANILLLDHKKPLSTGFPFPFGYLREFPFAINRSDIIVFTRASNDNIPENVKGLINKQGIFFSNTIFKRIILKNEEIDLSYLKGTRVCAYSGIANNDAFYQTLINAGLDIVFFAGFRDHMLLNETSINGIITQGKNKDATLFITTEKDFVKLPLEYQSIFGYIKMDIELNNKEGFFSDIDKLISK